MRRHLLRLAARAWPEVQLRVTAVWLTAAVGLMQTLSALAQNEEPKRFAPLLDRASSCWVGEGWPRTVGCDESGAACSGRLTAAAAPVKQALAQSPPAHPSDPPPVYDLPETQIRPSAPREHFGACPGNGGCHWGPGQGGLLAGRFDGHRLLRGREYLASLIRPPGPQRHRGLGQPLFRESWLQRPYSASWLMGTSIGGSLIDEWLGHKSGYLTGFRLGWDGDHYWGLETRLAFGQLELFGNGAPTVDQPIADGDSSLWYWDLDLLYYPWGDARWRPYWMLGFGVGQITFSDRLDNRYSQTAFALPIAFGVKYRCTDRLVLRAECTDNILFAFDSHHNFSFTLGLELRFGGTQRSYWPWNPGRRYW